MRKAVTIGSRAIGAGSPVLIIAEAGSNHDQRWEQALQLIEAAAAAGADAVKFQLYVTGDLYPPESPMYAAVKATELPRAWVPKLSDMAARRGLMFLASPFNQEAVDCLEAVGVPAYKMASSEIVNLPLLKHVAAKRKPMLLSTGMCDLADVHEALEVIRSEGNEEVILLQCTSLYPTPPEQVHLRALHTLQAAFHVPVGFSDHTSDLVIPAAAVALGACVIEKHLTINRHLPGPDHHYALDPGEFKRMVEGIRATEASLGLPVKRMLPEEAKAARRLSIRAARDITPGETLTDELIVLERPAQGIRPRLLGAILGRRARTPITKGAAITWDCV